MNLTELVTEAHEISANHGFHNYQPESQPALDSLRATRVALIHSEASEVLEALRDGSAPTHTWYRDSDGKPEGIPSELADIVIRVADFCGAEGIDLERAVEEKLHFNAGRPYKHGRQY
ncbi:hypothetical protein [Brevibacterium casei]|uniref:hypothetical protein n=1 Tax=Brevibacterium casei TaxID=33889 RepID=UPI0024204494|nr:hypothetical protein [Brevibacterium casei]